MKKVLLCVFIMAISAFAAQAELLTFNQAAELAQKEQAGAVTDMELDMERRSVSYELSIFADGYIHKLDVDAVSGQVTRRSKENLRENVASAFRNIKIDHIKAQAIAQAELPGSIMISFDTDVRGGKAVYEIGLADPKGLAYDIFIDATDGKVISSRQDEVIVSMPTISKQDAEKAALSALAGTVLYTTIDEDHGIAHYEVKMYAEEKLFEVRIDGANGKVLKIETD